MYLTIIKNGQTIDHRDLGIKCLSFERDSINPQNEYETVEGRHGLIPLSTTFGGRPLRASFFAQELDYLSYQVLKTEIFRLFAVESEMYLIDSRDEEKRWSAKVSNTFSIENLNFRSGKFTVEFLASIPFAESIENTLNQEIAQISGNKIQKYEHTTSTFEILNDGDEVIDPRLVPLIITYTGASTNLKIKNLTTGDEWQFTGMTTASDAIVLDGIRASKNGLSIYRDTNHKLITLALGWNSFQLSGTSGAFEISFDFRFYTI